MRRLKIIVMISSFIGLYINSSRVLATDGDVLHGAGTINQSMGGAGIATSIDAIGSNFNNVSSISFLKKDSIEFGAEFFLPQRQLSSSVSLPNGYHASGSVDSQSRDSVIPNIGLAYHIDDQLTFGFTALGIGGFGVDYPANAPNLSGHFSPISAPQSAGGFGSIYSSYQLLQITPSVAYKITPVFSVGLGFNLDYQSLAVNPWPAAPPNQSGYPTGSQAASSWGQGFTVGATYQALDNLRLGLSVKSPQWFNHLTWNSQYPNGSPATFSYNLNYPLIVGGGLSYEPVQSLLLGVDLKWINYTGTSGYGQKGWVNGSSGPYVQGFGWSDIFAVALGGQYKVDDKWTLRAGYNYGGNPIPPSQQFFNVFAPAVVQNHITIGAGYDFTEQLGLNLGYYHGFQNSVSGSFISSGAPGYPPINQAIPGTKVTNELSENSFSAQVAYKF